MNSETIESGTSNNNECQHCNGKGEISDGSATSAVIWCPWCKGTGKGA